MGNNSGLVTGCIVGGILAFIFVFACLYSIIKAIRDRRRIIEKNKGIRQQRLLSAESELGGALVPPPPPPPYSVIPEILEPEPEESEAEPVQRKIRLGSAPNIRAGRRGSAFAPPPEPEERRWEKEGLEYRAQGKTVHIHRTQSGELKSKGGAASRKGDRLKIHEAGFRQRSASADVPRSILPSGETDFTVGLLPRETNNMKSVKAPAELKPTIAIASSDQNSANAMIQVTVTTHEIKDPKGWV